VEHMGVTSVTIIYNKVPLMDYFRVVEDGEEGLLLLGKSDWAGHQADPAYFWLRRVEGKEIMMYFLVVMTDVIRCDTNNF